MCCVSERAECYFQVINIGDGAIARASMSQVRSAANAMFIQCASNYPSQGGTAKNIGTSHFPSCFHTGLYMMFFFHAEQILGGDNNLAVIMATFTPRVQCTTPFYRAQSCGNILAGMPATKNLEVFGPKSDPHMSEVLPQLVVSRKFCFGSIERFLVRFLIGFGGTFSRGGLLA